MNKYFSKLYKNISKIAKFNSLIRKYFHRTTKYKGDSIINQVTYQSILLSEKQVAYQFW